MTKIYLTPRFSSSLAKLYILSGRNIKRTKILELVIATTIVLGIKWFFSNATTDELSWIIGPTAFLVKVFGGIEFSWEAGLGYVNSTRQAIIAPSCSGINFLIAAFGMAFLQGHLRNKGTVSGFTWIPAALFLAYIITIHTNALRIILSLYFYRLDIYDYFITAERIHRIMGIVVYLCVLCAFSWVIEFFLKRCRHQLPIVLQKTIGSLALSFWALPFGCYLFVVMLVPLLNNPLAVYGPKVVEHYLTVLLVSLVVFCLFYLLRFIWFTTFVSALRRKRVRKKTKGFLHD